VGMINFYDCCAADRGLALLVRSYRNRVHPDLQERACPRGF
jgi:hypothetical protein